MWKRVLTIEVYEEDLSTLRIPCNFRRERKPLESVKFDDFVPVREMMGCSGRVRIPCIHTIRRFDETCNVSSLTACTPFRSLIITGQMSIWSPKFLFLLKCVFQKFNQIFFFFFLINRLALGCIYLN